MYKTDVLVPKKRNLKIFRKYFETWTCSLRCVLIKIVGTPIMFAILEPHAKGE